MHQLSYLCRHQFGNFFMVFFLFYFFFMCINPNCSFDFKELQNVANFEYERVFQFNFSSLIYYACDKIL